MPSDEIDPSEFFSSIDFTSDGETVPDDSGNVGFSKEGVVKSRPNPFSAIEQKLRIPEGSTKDALDALATLKKCTKGVADSATAVQKQAVAVVAKTQQASQGLQAIDMELLRADREQIRKEAFDMYENAKELFDAMKDTFMTTVSPPPAMCTAIATMLNSVQQSLDKLLKVNQVLREETEHYNEKYVKPDLNAADPDEQEYDYSPLQMADLVEKWSNAADEKNAKQLEIDVQARDAAKLIGTETSASEDADKT